MSDAKNPLDPLDTGHDYDGIREHDNRLPNWWLATLLIAVVFGYGYWIYYQVLRVGPSSIESYRAEVQQAAEHAEQLARAKGVVNDELLLAMAANSVTVSKGAATFKTTCVACHGANGQGVIGPNLTDDYWIHGGKPVDILHTVTNGVADKGMPQWGPVLGADSVEAVVAYVLTIKGTHVPGKAPQGVLSPSAENSPKTAIVTGAVVGK